MTVVNLCFQDIINIIENKLESFILNKIKECKILNEIELQYYIINFINLKLQEFNDFTWCIHNLYYLKKNRKYPDIVLFQNLLPTFCLELKYFGFHQPKQTSVFDDLKKLHGYFKTYPSSLLQGYSFNVFNMKSEEVITFEQKIKELITDKRVKYMLINLRTIKDYPNVKKKYEDYLKNLDLNFFKYNF